MKDFKAEEIDVLITCPKIIKDPPKKEMWLERGSWRNNMRLLSRKDDLEFEVFMRINARFQENFSIGLEYLPKDERGSLCLLRCNGPHGIFLGNPAVPQQHFLPHLHKAKPENITLGLRPEKGGEATREYVSYPQALVYFLKTIRVTNAEEFFPNIGQLSLNLEKEDQNHELS